MKTNVILFVFSLLLVSCLDSFFAPLIITGTVTDIDKEGAVFHAHIGDLGKSDIVEYGFVWDTIQYPTLEKSDKYIVHKRAEIGSFSAKISFGLLPAKVYYVRAFIRNATLTTYGEERIFVSQGGKLPEIISIYPEEGNLGDTILLVGKNFSSLNNIIKINHVKSEILRIVQDTLYFIVPKNLTKRVSDITLTYLNQSFTAKDSFALISPIIFNFDRKTGTYGDTVTITGKNFLKSKSTLNLNFDNFPAEFNVISDETITTKVSRYLDKPNCHINITMNNQTAVSEDIFSLTPLELYDFTPKNAISGSNIIIQGNYFCPLIKNNRVYIGGVLAKTVSSGNKTLEVTLPIQDTAIYENRNATIEVTIGGNIKAFNTNLVINDKWFRKADAPVNLYSQNCYVIDKTAYIGLYYSNEFWSYNTETNTWKKCASFPGKIRTSRSGFVSNNKIYFGTGVRPVGYTYESLNDWWEYNPDSDTWLQKKNFPKTLDGPIGFTTADGCYLANGFTKSYNSALKYYTYMLQTWKYDATKDSWSNEVLAKFENTKNEGMNFWYPLKANRNGNEIYISWGIASESRSTEKILICNTSTKTSTRIADLPIITYNSVIGFFLDGTVYLKRQDSSSYEKTDLYSYDKSTNVWQKQAFSIYSSINGGVDAFCFEVNDIGYIGHSSQNTKLYEFDPKR